MELVTGSTSVGATDPTCMESEVPEARRPPNFRLLPAARASRPIVLAALRALHLDPQLSARR